MTEPAGDLARVRPGGGEFFRSRWVEAPPGVDELDPAVLAPGFRAGAAACGLKGGGRTDLGLLVAGSECDSALLLTRNASAAAPVRVCRDECDRSAIQAVVVNSGNANAETGAAGYRDALAMRDRAAGRLGVEPPMVAVAETGTIGVPLPIDEVTAGIEAAAGAMSDRGGRELAEAIMTTDAWPKACSIRHRGGVTISAQAKGAGMIEPGFATMLCFVQTDAEVGDPEAALRAAVAGSFERITVDGQMSTNDTVLMQASGAAGAPLPDGLLEAVLLQLALDIVADGEGATRVARVEVTGAADEAEAERVARAVANSPLVKTALHGRDPNWGRIAQAAGMALAGAELDEIGADAINATELGEEVEEAEIGVRLGRGEGGAHVYLSDLTADYVRINAEYTT
jgi:glutamate N-acetyltransferase/amino-acid N-acetyltransferase